jgi:hypothetical protein
VLSCDLKIILKANNSPYIKRHRIPISTGADPIAI